MSRKPTPYDPKKAKAWRVDNARGIKRMTSADRARLHLAVLQGAGWSQRSIAGEAGVTTHVVNNVVRGQKMIRRDTEALLLAVTVDRVPTKTDYNASSGKPAEPFVPCVGTVRRLQALLFMGWTWKYLLEHYGIRQATLHQQGRWVTRTKHDQVAKAYDDLAHKVGPSAKTRTIARKYGYLGPLSWDDIDLDAEPVTDEPVEEGVDEVAVRRRLNGDKSVPLSRPEKFEACRIARERGMSFREIEDLLGIQKPERYLPAVGAGGAVEPVVPAHGAPGALVV